MYLINIKIMWCISIKRGRNKKRDTWCVHITSTFISSILIQMTITTEHKVPLNQIHFAKMWQMPSAIKSLKPQTWTSWQGERKSKQIYLDVDIFQSELSDVVIGCSRAGIAKKQKNTKKVKSVECTVLFFYVFQNNLVFWATSLMILQDRKSVV